MKYSLIGIMSVIITDFRNVRHESWVQWHHPYYPQHHKHPHQLSWKKWGLAWLMKFLGIQSTKHLSSSRFWFGNAPTLRYWAIVWSKLVQSFSPNLPVLSSSNPLFGSNYMELHFPKLPPQLLKKMLIGILSRLSETPLYQVPLNTNVV